jgi:hypothetical protein
MASAVDRADARAGKAEHQHRSLSPIAAIEYNVSVLEPD